METTTTVPAAPAAATKRAPRKTGKPATAKASKALERKGAAKADNSGKLALKTICGALKIEPKAARRKLRASELGFHVARDRWTFTPSQATKVREILKSTAN